MYKSIKVSLLVLILVSVAFANIPPDEVIKKEFNVEPGQELVLDLETGTEIEVIGWDKNIVSIELTVGGRDSDLFESEFEQKGNRIIVNTEYARRRNNVKCDSKIKVMVPHKFNVDFSTMGGSVLVENLEGLLEGKTMGGSLEFTKLTGEIDCETMGGSIDVTNSDADGRAKTMGGSINLEDITGDINASTMGGSIRQKNVKGRKSSKDSRGLDISTMGGSIDLDVVPNGAKVKTKGGSISVKSIESFLDAQTMGGDITVDAIDGWIDASTMGGDIEVTMVGDPSKGERNVYLKSEGGDIDLVVPKGLSMNIDIEIRWSKRQREPKISGNLGLEGSVSNDWKSHHGDHYKLISCEKEINGGKNKIRISTVNGDVRITEK